jgi:hypothetical protein
MRNKLIFLNPIQSYIPVIHSAFAVPFAPNAWNFRSIAITQNMALLFFGDILLILKTLLSHDKSFTIIHSCSYALYLDLKTSLIPEDFPMRKLALQPGITITPLVIVLNQTIHPSMILGLIN